MTKIITCSELRYRTLAELEALFRTLQIESRAHRLADEARDDLINQVGRMRKANIEDCDTRLRGWMAAGLVSDDFAPQIRSLYAGVDEGDEPFDPAGRAEAHITEILPAPQRQPVSRKRRMARSSTPSLIGAISASAWHKRELRVAYCSLG